MKCSTVSENNVLFNWQVERARRG